MLVVVTVAVIEEVIQAHNLLSAIQNPKSKSLVLMHLVGGCLLSLHPCKCANACFTAEMGCVERRALPQASLRVFRAHSMYTGFPSTI